MLIFRNIIKLSIKSKLSIKHKSKKKEQSPKTRRDIEKKTLITKEKSTKSKKILFMKRNNCRINSFRIRIEKNHL